MIGVNVVLKENAYNEARVHNDVLDGLFSPGTKGTISDTIEGRENDYMILVEGYEYPFYFYSEEFEVVP